MVEPFNTGGEKKTELEEPQRSGETSKSFPLCFKEDETFFTSAAPAESLDESILSSSELRQAFFNRLSELLSN